MVTFKQQHSWLKNVYGGATEFDHERGTSKMSLKTNKKEIKCQNQAMPFLQKWAERQNIFNIHELLYNNYQMLININENLCQQTPHARRLISAL